MYVCMYIYICGYSIDYRLIDVSTINTDVLIVGFIRHQEMMQATSTTSRSPKVNTYHH